MRLLLATGGVAVSAVGLLPLLCWAVGPDATAAVLLISGVLGCAVVLVRAFGPAEVLDDGHVSPGWMREQDRRPKGGRWPA